MFELSGADIAQLQDADLRSLVFRLALAELRTKGYPLSSVTAGGNQDAADGGIDVRVECPYETAAADFVPRRSTGFQVKKPDMPASAIRDEMRPAGVLRDAIRDLASKSGAYVIVSGQASLTDKRLKERRKAMVEALGDVDTESQLLTDFYDQDRLATWANAFPGICTWIRERIGRQLGGWRGLGGSFPGTYLTDDEPCLINGSSPEGKLITALEGIHCIRGILQEPRKCVRLIGLSGVGKTRLVQALFENTVGKQPLDAAIAVYTDYSEETTPSARQMAQWLIAQGYRAILIIDNCNPRTHGEIARICMETASKISLLTVEYDVADDEPEYTDVFILESGSTKVVTAWIKEAFPEISHVDRETIAGFSHGNFRVASALAATVGKGETLGRLKSRDLFERLFRQRNEPDQQLLHAAEDLSLLYSIDGQDISEAGELGIVSSLRGFSVRQLYEALAELQRRGIVQARGRFRAILPQAIANRLAVHALERIPPVSFQNFCRALTPRMLKSAARRLGLLHDSPAARGVVAQWLRSDGPLGDLLDGDGDRPQILAHVAPVAPEAVLSKFEDNAHRIDLRRWYGLIRTIGYDPKLFHRAAFLLARIAASEPESNNLSSLRQAFSEMFHIYLSGTQALPEQRRLFIRSLANSSDENCRKSSVIALHALLESQSFMSSFNYAFGARSRDFGWHPKNEHEVGEWYDGASALAIELLPEAEARSVLAGQVRQLWCYRACWHTLNRVADSFSKKGPWIEGWNAARATLKYDAEKMSTDDQVELERFIDRLKPTDLLNQVRAVVLDRMNHGYDFSDGEKDDEDGTKGWERARLLAKEMGRAVAASHSVREEFLPELLTAPQAHRGFEFGQGLAEGAESLAMVWRELIAAYRAAGSGQRNVMVLGGFLSEADCRDRVFAASALDVLLDDQELSPILPYLQARIGIDEIGVTRLRRAITKAAVAAHDLYYIANGSIATAPPEALAALLGEIATLTDGGQVALEILHMYFSCHREGSPEKHPALVTVGREILAQAAPNKRHRSDFAIGEVILACLSGGDGEPAAKKLCEGTRSAVERSDVFIHDTSHSLEAVFKVQPFIALDSFLLPSVAPDCLKVFHRSLDKPNAIEKLSPVVLHDWAGRDPETRYPLLGECLSPFEFKDEKEVGVSKLFLAMLERAPDKRLFLGDLHDHLQPRSWGGSLADILVKRMAHLEKLAEEDDGVRDWIAESRNEVEAWIQLERRRDYGREASFE